MNHKKYSYIILMPIICATVLLCSCVSVETRMKSMLGQHYSTVVAQWGPAKTQASDGKGGKVMTWVFSSSYTTQGTINSTTTHNSNTSAYGNIQGNTSYYPNNSYSSYSGNINANTYGNSNTNTTYTPPQTHTNNFIRSFMVNRQGIIYGYAWRGWNPNF